MYTVLAKPGKGGGGGAGRVGYSNMKVVYMCHGRFKYRGRREWSLTENGAGGGGFQNWPTRDKGVLELKITKKRIFFLKEDLFDLHRSKKKWSL